MSLPFYAQTFTVRGRVEDKEGTALPYAHVLISAYKQPDSLIQYAVTDSTGIYSVGVAAGHYYIEADFLGYKKNRKNIVISKDTTLNFIMENQPESLDSVVVKVKIPEAVYRHDTLRYNLKKIASGQERRLRELVEKLPGIDTDENGNLTANGEKISQLLIEGKNVFGKPDVALDNLDAEMVSGIELIQNYKERGELNRHDKGKTVLNVRLKSAYKNKWKGKVSPGFGIEKKYAVKGNLYHFGLKNDFFIQGNSLNTGENIIDINDLINFSGGLSDLSEQSGNISINLNNNPLWKLIDNEPVHKKTEHFGGLNWAFDNQKNLQWQFNLYVANENTARKKSYTRYYAAQNAPIIVNGLHLDNFSSLLAGFYGHLRLIPAKNQLLEYETNGYQIRQSSRELETNTDTFNNSLHAYNRYLYQALKWQLKAGAYSFNTKAGIEWQSGDDKAGWHSDHPFLGISTVPYTWNQLRRQLNTTYRFDVNTERNINSAVRIRPGFTYNYFTSEHQIDIAPSPGFQKFGGHLANQIFYIRIYNDYNSFFHFDITNNFSYLRDVSGQTKKFYLPEFRFKLQFKKSHYLRFGFSQQMKPLSFALWFPYRYIKDYYQWNKSSVHYPDPILSRIWSMQYLIYDLFSGTLLSIGGRRVYYLNNTGYHIRRQPGYSVNNIEFFRGAENFLAYGLLQKRWDGIPFKFSLKSSFYSFENPQKIEDHDGKVSGKSIGLRARIFSVFRHSAFQTDFSYQVRKQKINEYSAGILKYQTSYFFQKPSLTLSYKKNHWSVRITQSYRYYRSGQKVLNRAETGLKLWYQSRLKGLEFYVNFHDIFHLNNNQVLESGFYHAYTEESVKYDMGGYILTGFTFTF